MKENQIDQLRKGMEHSLLCVGIDPDMTKIPAEVMSPLQFIRETIDATANYVCAYKFQKAFFDLIDPSILGTAISYVHLNYPGIPVILDCKIGDIGNTMEAYMKHIFDDLEADGVVVNPYMGDEVMAFAKKYPEKIFVTLVRTSGAGAGIVQDVPLLNKLPLWQYILKLATDRWNGEGNIVPVIASKDGLVYEEIRKLIPDDMPILFAGVGAQGGTIEQVGRLLNSNRSGVFVNSSRGIIYAKPNEGEKWNEAVGRSAKTLMEELNHAR